MSKFVEKLNLKEMAEEDIYFAKRDRELIDALHKKKLKKVVGCAKEDEKRFEKISNKHVHKPKKLARAFRYHGMPLIALGILVMPQGLLIAQCLYRP